MLAYSEKPKRPKPRRRATSPIIDVKEHLDQGRIWPCSTRPHRSPQQQARGLTDRDRRRIQDAIDRSVSANTRIITPQPCTPSIG